MTPPGPERQSVKREQSPGLFQDWFMIQGWYYPKTIQYLVIPKNGMTKTYSITAYSNTPRFVLFDIVLVCFGKPWVGILTFSLCNTGGYTPISYMQPHWGSMWKLKIIQRNGDAVESPKKVGRVFPSNFDGVLPVYCIKHRCCHAWLWWGTFQTTQTKWRGP